MPLVNRPLPKTLPMRMPTLRVRHRDPSHHFGKLSIVSRPQNKVPVVGMRQYAAIRMAVRS